MRYKPRFWALWAAIACLPGLVLAGGVAMAGSEPAPTSAAQLTIDPASVRNSVAYLVRAHGISEAEALRRLEVQQQATSVERELVTALPTRYAGYWIDQQRGGQLVIALTGAAGPSDVRRYVKSAAVRFRVESAKYSLAELAIAGASVERARPATSPISTRIDHQRNKVVVYEASNPKALAVPADVRLRSALSAAGDKVVLDVPDAQRLRQLSDWLTAEKEPRAPTTKLAAAASVPSCRAFLCTAGAPMRGGYRLDVSRDAGGRGPCTNGFNLRNQANGALYTLVAAHCVRGARHTKVDYTFHNNVSVGVEHSAAGFVNTVFPTDYAVLPYTSSPGGTRWLPRNRNEVSSICVAGESTTACRNGAIAIIGVQRYEDMRSGQVVCHTGSTEADYGGAGWVPGTRCGVINGWDSAGIRTNTCGRPGDSGSPLFSEVNRKAYGILHGGTVAQGKCRTGREFSTFSPISKIQAKLPSTIRVVVVP